MPFREHAENTTQAITEVLGQSVDSEQRAAVTKLIEDALIQAALEEQQRCVRTVKACCSADQDIAHKIAGNIREHELSVMANLKGLT